MVVGTEKAPPKGFARRDWLFEVQVQDLRDKVWCEPVILRTGKEVREFINLALSTFKSPDRVSESWTYNAITFAILRQKLREKDQRSYIRIVSLEDQPRREVTIKMGGGYVNDQLRWYRELTDRMVLMELELKRLQERFEPTVDSGD